ESELRKLGIRVPDGLLSPRKERDGRILRVAPNDKRDGYIYEQYSRGVPFKDIIAAVNDNPAWTHFEHDNPKDRMTAATRAMDRYSDRHRLPKLKRRPRKGKLNST